METKNREKLLLLATGVVAGLWLLNLLVVSPLIDSWHSRSAEMAKLKKNLESGAMLVRRESILRDRWDNMRANALPDNPTVAERQLFSAFNHWVGSGGVTPGSFRPQFQEGDSNYTTVDCRSDITGGPNGVMDFVQAMTKDPLANKVDSFALNAKDDNGRQLALALDLDGLILTDSDPTSVTPTPKAADAASSQDPDSGTNTVLDPFHLIARNNIFDQSRVYISGNIRHVIVHHVTTIASDGASPDVSEDGKGSAFFVGDDISSTKPYNVGDSVGDFKLARVSINTVTLTNASNTFNLPVDLSASLRREDNGPWEISSYTAPAPETNATSATNSESSAASPSASGSSADSVLERLKKQRESEEK